MSTTPDLHTLSGAYAAHALDAAEREGFERHLARCSACAGEVAEFAETLARLGAAEAAAPPAGLKEQVLAALPEVRQLAPVAAVSPAGARRRWPARRWGRFALAASVAGAVGLGGLAVQQHREADQARDRAAAAQAAASASAASAARFAALLAAPDARTVSARDGAGSGTVVWSPARGQAAFLAAGLPQPKAGTTYQLWYDDAGTMRPAGLLPGAGGSVLLTGAIDGASGVGVTLEPAGGSLHPTGRPVMLLAFG
ncbi:anti-sigma factor [Kitasatospora sp. NPDC002227]|uniref:anti-sigma factor n=1 Tax=Kitasatospora sp. NPDC002227 TaxID=3154773 RepID=UPI003320F70E